MNEPKLFDVADLLQFISGQFEKPEDVKGFYPIVLFLATNYDKIFVPLGFTAQQIIDDGILEDALQAASSDEEAYWYVLDRVSNLYYETWPS